MHTLQVLEKKLGYTFRCKEQLQAALYHSSYANEHRCCGVSSNERLEFLGDAVLGLVTADYLFHRHPDLPEGDLTRIRAALVCEESLHEVAQKLELGRYLRLGRGEEAGGGRERTSILADATEDHSVEETLTNQGFLTERLLENAETIAADARIHYIHLTENAGIAANTNQALPYARGEYIGLLDHDDVLTPNALYEMADAITKANDRGVRVAFAYSDEDKCNGDETKYYDPNHKEDFNYDLILSNNYICHFLVMDADLMKKLAFRPECDGAQDYDLVLRAVSEVLAADGRSGEERILHIPRVLYHWRCHEASTAANPHSKKYAYEAGLRALQDHAAERGIPAKAEETRHVGFYRLQYTEVLQERPDVAAVGGRVLSGKNRGRIAGGRMTADGKVFYEGLPKDFGGYLHRAELSQDAEALDLRCIRLRSADRELFEKIVGVPYTEVVRGPEQQPVFDSSTLPAGADIRLLSLQLSEALRKRGRLLYLPEYPEKWERL